MLLSSAPALSAVELDAAVQQVLRATELLDGARRRSRGRRLVGDDADARRALVLALTAQADAALYEARVVLDAVLREAALDAVLAPRPVIELR